MCSQFQRHPSRHQSFQSVFVGLVSLQAITLHDTGGISKVSRVFFHRDFKTPFWWIHVLGEKKPKVWFCWNHRTIFLVNEPSTISKSFQSGWLCVNLIIHQTSKIHSSNLQNTLEIKAFWIKKKLFKPPSGFSVMVAWLTDRTQLWDDSNGPQNL